MWLHDPGLFTRSIAAMVTPRKMSSDARRCRVLVGAISIAGNSAGAGGAGRVSVSSSGGAVVVMVVLCWQVQPGIVTAPRRKRTRPARVGRAGRAMEIVSEVRPY